MSMNMVFTIGILMHNWYPKPGSLMILNALASPIKKRALPADY